MNFVSKSTVYAKWKIFRMLLRNQQIYTKSNIYVKFIILHAKSAEFMPKRTFLECKTIKFSKFKHFFHIFTKNGIKNQHI